MAELSDRIALYIDFENLARGFTRSSRDEFDIHLVLARLVEKGKVVMKRAYCDWSRFSKFKDALHEAGIELVEVPRRSVTGKNSADIRMVVDAMDMCFAKEHIGTFVIASGDSDFSPLVSKLKENGKHVIGLGMRGSTSNLLVEACDEFIFYEDLGKSESRRPKGGANLPKEKKEAFDLLFESIDALQRENVAIIWSSIIKETMIRKRPSFSESAHGYRSFSALLEEAQKLGFIQLRRDERSGSYIVVDYGRQTTNGEEPREESREKPREKPQKRVRRSPASKSTAKAKRSTEIGRAPVPKQKKPTAKRTTVGGMRRPQKKTSEGEATPGDSPEESS